MQSIHGLIEFFFSPHLYILVGVSLLGAGAAMGGYYLLPWVARQRQRGRLLRTRNK